MKKIISVFCKNTHINVKIIIKGQIQIIFSCCHLSIQVSMDILHKHRKLINDFNIKQGITDSYMQGAVLSTQMQERRNGIFANISFVVNFK